MEKLKHETDKDYALFCKFLQQPEYNIEIFCIQYNLSAARIHALAAKNSWKKRYTDEQAFLYQEYTKNKQALLQQLSKDEAQRESEVKSLSLHLIQEALARHALTLKDPRANLRIRDIEILNQIYKSIQKVSTEDGPDLSELSDEQLMVIQSVLNTKDQGKE